MEVTHCRFLFVCIICLLCTIKGCSGMLLSCGAGEFLNTTDGINPSCQECAINSYNEDVRHTMVSCKPCEVFREDIHHVEEVQPCTKKSRTKILKCAEGFRLEDSPHLYGCKPCPLEIETPGCSISVHDVTATVIPSPVTPNYTITSTNFTFKGDESCVHRPDNCCRNEFLNVNCTQNKEATGGVCCQPCPVGTHMNKTNHSEPSCVSIHLSYETEINKGFFEKDFFDTKLVTGIGGGTFICAVLIFFILLIAIKKGKLYSRYKFVPTNST